MFTPITILLMVLMVVLSAVNIFESTLATKDREECRIEKQKLAVREIKLEKKEEELNDREQAISFLEEDSVVVSSKYVTSESDVYKYSTIEEMEKAIHKRLISNIGQTIAKEYAPRLNMEATPEGRICYSIRLRVKQM